MDDQVKNLEVELTRTLQQTAELAAEIDRAKQPEGELPHYSQIENAAHDVAQRLGQAIQSVRSEQVQQQGGDAADCPSCGRSCRVQKKQRTITTVDGETAITEATAYCRPCRRSFFPSA